MDDQLKKAKSGAKITGFIVVLGIMAIIAAGYNLATMLILWVFTPVFLVSLILFVLYLYRIYKLKN